MMYAENKHSLLIVLQGLDAARKDGTVRHVFTGMNPEGCICTSFKQPTAKELAHDFLWRVHPHVPAKGSVVIFNRSHYEDVLVARVHGLVPEKVWSKRYDQINDFEQLIATENNTTILKFFLHISKEEQLARFENMQEEFKNRSSCIFPKRNSLPASKSDWMTPNASGRSVNRIIRNATTGMITRRHSRTCLTRRARSTLPGLSFLPTTNGSAIWPFRRSLSDTWEIW